MKRPLALAVMICLPILMTAQDNNHFRFIQDGAFASLSGSPAAGGFFNFQVSRGFSTTAGSSASLQYSAVSFTPGSITITNVFGSIPSGAFTGHNTQNLILDIDTTTLSGFFSQTCTLDLTTFVFTCGPGPAGLIHLEFRENGAIRTRILALEKETISGPVTTRTHQKSDSSTADVQGSLFGTPISGANANVGVNHQSTLEIVHD